MSGASSSGDNAEGKSEAEAAQLEDASLFDPFDDDILAELCSSLVDDPSPMPSPQPHRTLPVGSWGITGLFGNPAQLGFMPHSDET